MLTNSTSASDRGHLFSYLITDFSSTSDFQTMLNGISERTMIKTGVDVNTSDKILTLYTCYQDIFEGGRLVIFARLVREGESSEVDTSKAYFNHSARYPQAYYDQLGLANPYEKLTEPIAIDGETVSQTDTAESSAVENKTESTAPNVTAAPNTTSAPSADPTPSVQPEPSLSDVPESSAVTENTTNNEEAVSETQSVSVTQEVKPSENEVTAAAQPEPSEAPTQAVENTTSPAAQPSENAVSGE